MFVVIFEVQPKEDRRSDYLDLAKQLRPKLEAIDGFIDNERFGSKRKEGRLLSLSTWRDEKAVVWWRAHGEHHGAQETGRFEVFEDYHIRVGEVISDTAPPIAIDEKRFDETVTGEAKFCTITEVSPGNSKPSPRPDPPLGQLQPEPRANGLLGHELFESITAPGKLLILASWRDEFAAREWTPGSSDVTGAVRHRQVRIIRDYGMFDRLEAPQFYPDVTK